MTQQDRLSIEDLERMLARGKTVDAQWSPVLNQLLDVMQENERLKDMLERRGMVFTERHFTNVITNSEDAALLKSRDINAPENEISMG